MYWYGNPSNDVTTPPSAISKASPAHVSQRLAPGPWSSLRDHITDLEHQLRTFQQSQQRQTELEEKSLLEQELDQLARLTKEQEENAQLAIAAKKREESYHSCNDSSIDGGGGGGGGGGGDSVDTDALSIASMDGASSIHIADSSSPERHSARCTREIACVPGEECTGCGMVTYLTNYGIIIC